MAMIAGSLAIGCVGPEEGDDESSQESNNPAGIVEGSVEAAIVVKLANDATLQELIDDVRLPELAALAIDAYRKGDDETAGTEDDERFESLAELDAIPHVRANEFTTMLAFARTRPSAVIAGRVLWPNDSPVQPALGIYAFKTDGTKYFKHDGQLNRAFSIAVEPGDYYVVAYQSARRTFALAGANDQLAVVSVSAGDNATNLEPTNTRAKKIPVEPASPLTYGCAGLGYAGRCGDSGEYDQGAGTPLATVSWCEANILRRKECAATEQCALVNDDIGNNCVPR
jgi:hypothetical protein